MTTPLQCLEECMEHDDLLSDWERNFLDSIERTMFSEYGTISFRQTEKLCQIYARVTQEQP